MGVGGGGGICWGIKNIEGEGGGNKQFTPDEGGQEEGGKGGGAGIGYKQRVSIRVE